MQLVGRYVEPAPIWPWIVGGIVVIAIGFVSLRSLSRSGGDETGARALTVPDELTPFRALQILREVAAAHSEGSAERAAVEEAAARIERHYFGGEGEAPDLGALVRAHVETRAS